jgi:uncharacterized membrane protein (UPF0136 family)
MTLDPIYLTNLILCAIILIVGIIGYRRSEEMWPLLIGIAFGLFGVSHLLTLLGLREALETLLIVIRTLAYLVVAVTVFWVAFRY